MRLNIFLLLSIVGLASVNGYGQITSPTADVASATQYSSTHQDSLYVFFNPIMGRIKAAHSTRITSDIRWFKFNMTTKQFDLIDQSLGAVSSDLAITESGCYSVSIQPIAGNIETDTAWVYLDNFEVTSVTTENTCNYLQLNINTKPAYYENIITHYDISQLPNLLPKSKKNNLDIVAKQNDITILNGPIVTKQKNLAYILNDTILPVEDSYYTLVVKDVFGKKVAYQTPTILAIAPLAKFDVAIWNGTNWSSAGIKNEGQAPLKLQLTSKSKNCDSILWTGFNDPNLFYAGGDSLLWNVGNLATDNQYEPKELLPGKYKVRLIATKISSGCRDTVTLKYVNVLYSKIDPSLIPNVFTPNGSYPVFKFKTDDTTLVHSIRDFEIKIFNRWGNTVYSYSGTVGDWKGWDGKTDGSGADAVPGVYYFIINARGWDDVSYSGGPYKGFFYLFRNN